MEYKINKSEIFEYFKEDTDLPLKITKNNLFKKVILLNLYNVLFK